jgi:RES domain-containing protein
VTRVTTIHRDDTHRLIPSRWADRSVLERVSGDPGDLEALFELEGATNDRLLGGANLLAGISVHELLFGVPHAHIVNAAFCHARPGGGRFSSPERGAWYAAFDLDTARAEVAFHKAEELREIGWAEPETFTFVDYRAGFHGDFHDIRRDPAQAACRSPTSYRASQRLAAELLAAGSGGIVYPSVRHRRGTCLACFRPALVTNVRKGSTVTLRFP